MIASAPRRQTLPKLSIQFCLIHFVDCLCAIFIRAYAKYDKKLYFPLGWTLDENVCYLISLRLITQRRLRGILALLWSENRKPLPQIAFSQLFKHKISAQCGKNLTMRASRAINFYFFKKSAIFENIFPPYVIWGHNLIDFPAIHRRW